MILLPFRSSLALLDYPYRFNECTRAFLPQCPTMSISALHDISLNSLPFTIQLQGKAAETIFEHQQSSRVLPLTIDS